MRLDEQRSPNLRRERGKRGEKKNGCSSRRPVVDTRAAQLPAGILKTKRVSSTPD